MRRIEPGTRIGHYFEIVGELGYGGMGTVYRAVQHPIGRLVAVKVIRLDESRNESEVEELRARLLREAQAAGILAHPGIVTIHHAGEHEGLPYIVMELVEGESVEAVLRRGPMRPAEAARVVRQAAEALDYAHAKGVIHRDVKPANVLLDSAGRAKLCDFGIAKQLTGVQGLTRTGMVAGSDSFMSPEQWRAETLDGRADQYALAVMAFQSLVGRHPFPARSMPELMSAVCFGDRPRASEVCGELNPGVDAVLARGMAKRREERYASCTEFAQALERACERVAAVVPAGSPAAGVCRSCGASLPSGEDLCSFCASHQPVDLDFFVEPKPTPAATAAGEPADRFSSWFPSEAAAEAAPPLSPAFEPQSSPPEGVPAPQPPPSAPESVLPTSAPPATPPADVPMAQPSSSASEPVLPASLPAPRFPSPPGRNRSRILLSVVAAILIAGGVLAIFRLQPLGRQEDSKPEAGPVTVTSPPGPSQPGRWPPAPKPEPPAVNPAPVTRPPAVAAAPASMAGHWSLSRAVPSGSPFRPDSVTLSLTEDGGWVRGTLGGRYRAPRSSGTKPDVSFSFGGPVRSGNMKFPWAAGDGTKGEIEFIRRPNDSESLEIVWYAADRKFVFDDVVVRVRSGSGGVTVTEAERPSGASQPGQRPPETANPAPAAPPPARVKAPAPPTVAADAKLVIEVTASDTCWVSATVDGKKTVAVLRDGETRRFTGSERASLFLGNAGGIEIRVNGKSIGPVGPRGQLRTVVITPEGFSITNPREKEEQPNQQ